MSDLSKLKTMKSNVKLIHLKTKKSFDLPNYNSMIFIGKLDSKNYTDIDLSDLPETDIVSRLHAGIEIKENNYYINDLGSNNGTYLNNVKLLPYENYLLKFGDKVELGKDGKVVLIFQKNQSKITSQKSRYFFNKLVGAGLMTTSVIILANNTTIGLFLCLPGVLFSLIGIFLLAVNKENTLLGCVFFILGIVTIVGTDALVTSINFLSLIISFILFFIGYLLIIQYK